MIVKCNQNVKDENRVFHRTLLATKVLNHNIAAPKKQNQATDIKTLSAMYQHNSDAMIEDEIHEQQYRIEHLLLEKDSDNNNMLLRSPSSPRMTICRLEHSIEEQEPLAPLPTPSSPIHSQFQRDDKILRWHDTRGLSSVYFPSLSVNHANTTIQETNHRCDCNSKKRMVSDLSSLPLPKHIRLLPRRRKRVQRNHRN